MPLGSGFAWIDDDDRVADLLQVLELVGRLLGEHEDRAVGRAAHQPVDERDLAVVLVHSRAEHDPQVELVERF